MDLRYLVLAKATAIAAVAVILSWAATAQGEPTVIPLLGGTPIPTQPPYFVMAWSATDNLVHTLESTDGVTWMRPMTMPGPASTDGTAVAYDGSRTWMVMWNSGGGLNFVTGLGGLPSTTATGITWSATATVLPTTTPARGTPTVAFGKQSFVAVFQDTAMLRIIPSVFPAPAIATDAPLGFAGSQPALAFGAGRFVLAFMDAQRNLLVRTSLDGLCWSAPRTIFPYTRNGDFATSASGVSLSFADGAFVAVGRLTTYNAEGDSDVIGSRLGVFKSPDGVSWTTVVGPNAGPAVYANYAGIPGAAFAQCRLVTAYATHAAGDNVGSHLATPDLCPGPSSFTFDAVRTFGVATAPTAQPDRKMAVVFAEGGGPNLVPTPTLRFPASIEFGSVPIGETRQRRLTITNTSDTSATVSLPAPLPGRFEWNAFTGTLACGGTADVFVEFTPVSEGTTQRTLTATSNATGSPHSVSLRGRGIWGVTP
jgi:hypothetical protein